VTGDIEKRKGEHIDIVLQQDVSGKGVTTGFEKFFLSHRALPEIDLDQIDLSLSLMNRHLKAPLFISSMTGGTAQAQQINQHLAETAQALGLAMGVGSQRAAIEHPPLEATFRIRQVAPDILLFANLGAVQLNYGYGVAEARRAVASIEADALFLHLNSLQEALQPGGDTRWSGLLKKIEDLVSKLEVPVVVKEVGNGIDAASARCLVDCGVAAIDVAGAGGTSWSEVEAFRQKSETHRRVAHAFAGWGTPTALALIQARQALPATPLFASGGIRSGIDAAKAIALGACLVGRAAPLLNPALDKGQAVYDNFAAMLDELRITAFCCGARDLEELGKVTVYRHDTWEPVSGVP